MTNYKRNRQITKEVDKLQNRKTNYKRGRQTTKDRHTFRKKGFLKSYLLGLKYIFLNHMHL